MQTVNLATILKAIKNATDIIFPIHSSVMFFVYVFKSFPNVKTKLELDCTHLLKMVVKKCQIHQKNLNLLSSLNFTQFQFE